jgi:hypothetical protein
VTHPTASAGGEAVTTPAPTLGDLVEVADVDTVVRLDGTGDRLRELVLTGDVVESLGAVLEVANAAVGAGFFVVGPFGSGKSHFLAAVGELLADPAVASGAAGWDSGLRRLANGARQSLVVAVPLVEYRAGAALEDVVADRAWRGLAQTLPTSNPDRTAGWDGVLAAAQAAGHPGMVLLLDELSEFLRSKQGPALTEDLRFLQFLGEWAGTRPVIVIAALQENIDEVANVSHRQLARIRDRFRPSLTLSMRHVEDLVRGRLVRLRPEAQPWIDRSWKETAAAFPDGHFSRERFDKCYPLHPDTLAVLEGLRFLLSQQRGVVDFICRRLRGSLDRAYAGLVTPDEVFDHFRGRLLERPESARLAETVVPYFERALGELVDDDDQELALRTVKLLCVLEASAVERPRSAAELASMLVARVSDVDPRANVAYLERAILEPITERGAYVVARPGPPTTYAIELDADVTLVAQARASQVRAELAAGDRRQVATLCQLGSSPQLPLHLLGEVGIARRQLLWQNTQRALFVGTVRLLELTAGEVAALVSQARTAGAEACLLIGEVELEEAPAARERAALLCSGNERLALWVPAELRSDERHTVAELHSRAVVLASARLEGRAELVEVLERSRDADEARARELLRRVYFEGLVAGVDLPSLAGLPFDRQLPRLADPVLSALHPRHRDVAPRGELVGDRLLRQLLDEVIVPGRVGPVALGRGQLRQLIEGYLVPLGLARVRKEGAVVAPDPTRSRAVSAVLQLVGDGDAVPTLDVVRALADGEVGLTGPEAILVLNACVQTGLLEAWRGRRRQSEPFVAVTATDRLGPGELVEPDVRSAVAQMGPIVGPGPHEPWTAGTQRLAWDHARSWLQARREELLETNAGLSRFGEVPALGGSDPGPVLDDLALVGSVVDACPAGLLAAAGLRALVAAIGAAGGGVVDAARRLGAVCRFMRDDLRRVEEAAAYLSHPDLTIPESDPALLSLRDAALGLIRLSLRLAAEDRTGELFGANREFRGAYLAAYQEGHDRYYAAVTADALEAVRAVPSYRALSRFAAIGALAVPDDRVKVDRLMAGSAPPPCRRPVSVELAWKPRCSCGLALGDTAPSLDAGAVIEVAERGVRQYLAELATLELSARLADAIVDLSALGSNDLAADLRLLQAAAASGDPVDPSMLTSLLGDAVVGVLRDVLSGGQLIVTRDLAALREDLIGRRYPKRRLLEILTAWVDAAGELPPTGFVSVVDSSDRATPPPAGVASAGASSATTAFLAQRFPGVAALLPAQQSADAFWLAAWWAGRPSPPAWLTTPLLANPERLRAAADAATGDLAALADLVDLDARVGPNSILGDQVAVALDLTSRPASEVIKVLTSERLLRHPVRLAAEQLLGRVAADWQLAALVDRPPGFEHALLKDGERAPVACLLDAARHLSALEQGAGGVSGPMLVEGLYPSHYAPVRALISRADLEAAKGAVITPDAVGHFRSAAERLLAVIDKDFGSYADAGFPGCLPVSDIGDAVVAPLLRTHGRVGVLIIDAMRADLASRVVELIAATLPGRPVERRWAVVPSPTRTAESVAAMHLGRPVGAGSVPAHPDRDKVAFAHLGYEAAAIIGADRDAHTAEVTALWASGPPISVAVATGVDERLHRTSVELAGLLEESAAALGRRVVPSLSALSPEVPLVVLADHGFRENPSWGRGPEGRYVHGGPSLEECVVPVVVFGVAP